MGIPTFSAGGILLQRQERDTLIVIVEWEKGVEKKWAPILRQLPKGGQRSNETLEQTASREVREETGYETRIIKKAGEAQWSYERSGQVWDETVHYYFMEPTSLIAGEHDDEFDYVRWVKIEEAAQILSYPPERELIFKLIGNGQLP